MNKILRRWHEADPSLKMFLIGVLFLGINSGIVSGAFNNYLHDVQGLTSQQRGILEFPREFPGFALVFMTGALAFLSVEKWAVLTGIFAGHGRLIAYGAPAGITALLFAVIGVTELVIIRDEIATSVLKKITARAKK